METMYSVTRDDLRDLIFEGVASGASIISGAPMQNVAVVASVLFAVAEEPTYMQFLSEKINERNQSAGRLCDLLAEFGGSFGGNVLAAWVVENHQGVEFFLPEVINLDDILDSLNQILSGGGQRMAYTHFGGRRRSSEQYTKYVVELGDFFPIHVTTDTYPVKLYTAQGEGHTPTAVYDIAGMLKLEKGRAWPFFFKVLVNNDFKHYGTQPVIEVEIKVPTHGGDMPKLVEGDYGRNNIPRVEMWVEGVWCPEKIWRTPEELTIEDFLEEGNMEIRRAMVEVAGWGTLLEGVETRVIDEEKSHKAQLIATDIHDNRATGRGNAARRWAGEVEDMPAIREVAERSGKPPHELVDDILDTLLSGGDKREQIWRAKGEPVHLLKLEDFSSDRVYYHRVDPRIKTAKEALKACFRLDHTYKPEVET